MTPSQLSFLDKYYEFAEKCDDDYAVMAKTIKLAGSKRRPNKIIKNLEMLGVDSEYKEYYEILIAKVTDEMVCRARWFIQRERGNAMTLF